MVYRDSVVTGYWKGNIYQGKELKPPYKITNIRNISRYTITKTVDRANEVRIKILMGGSDNTEIEEFALAYDSGTEYRMGNTFGIQNTSFPLYVKISYRTWNQMHTAHHDVIFEFTIYEAGTWDVIISN